MKIGKFNRMLQISPIVLSVIALGFSIYVFRQSQNDNLVVNLNRYHGNYMSNISSYNIAIMPAVVNTFWEVTIINNGEQTTSVLDYDIEQKNENFPLNYSGMNQGIYDEKMLKVNLPIVLKPGESKIYYLKLGVILDSCAYSFIKNESNFKEEFEIESLIKFLSLQSIDMFGNLVQLYSQDSTYHGFSIDLKNRQDMYFLLTLKTGRGQYFRDFGFWYKHKEF